HSLNIQTAKKAVPRIVNVNVPRPVIADKPLDPISSSSDLTHLFRQTIGGCPRGRVRRECLCPRRARLPLYQATRAELPLRLRTSAPLLEIGAMQQAPISHSLAAAQSLPDFR